MSAYLPHSDAYEYVLPIAIKFLEKYKILFNGVSLCQNRKKGNKSESHTRTEIEIPFVVNVESGVWSGAHSILR